MATPDRIDRMATQATTKVNGTLARLRSLASGFLVATVIIAAACFAAGWWVFDRSRGGWLVIGGIICLIPVLAALTARWFVGATARTAPRLMSDISMLLRESRQAASALIDHDTGAPIVSTAKSFGELRAVLKQRKTDLPALFAGVRALTNVPGLLAIALLGTIAVGGLGTILVLVGIFS